MGEVNAGMGFITLVGQQCIFIIVNDPKKVAMKKYLFVATLLFSFYYPSFSQTDSYELSKEQTKDILSQIKLDTAKILRDYGESICKCIDSITLNDKDNTQLITETAACIEKETYSYQTIMAAMRGLQNSTKEIRVNLNKESEQYKTY